jgi:hypothetical protein
LHTKQCKRHSLHIFNCRLGAKQHRYRGCANVQRMSGLFFSISTVQL